MPWDLVFFWSFYTWHMVHMLVIAEILQCLMIQREYTGIHYRIWTSSSVNISHIISPSSVLAGIFAFFATREKLRYSKTLKAWDFAHFEPAVDVSWSILATKVGKITLLMPENQSALMIYNNGVQVFMFFKSRPPQPCMSNLLPLFHLLCMEKGDPEYSGTAKGRMEEFSRGWRPNEEDR